MNELTNLAQCQGAVDSIIQAALSGTDAALRYQDGAGSSYIRWGVVQKRTHEAIEQHWNKRSAWQPIETAPKDGTYVLLYSCEADAYYVGQYASWRVGGQQTWLDYDGVDLSLIFPTHWQPLPTPPETTT